MALREVTAALVARGVQADSGVIIASATALEICVGVLNALSVMPGEKIEDGERALLVAAAELVQDIGDDDSRDVVGTDSGEKE